MSTKPKEEVLELEDTIDDTRYESFIKEMRAENSTKKINKEVIADKYVLERLIGEGGMAQVYLATQQPLGNHVAIKILSNDFLQEEDALPRFELEAKTTSMLCHPNTVTLIDFGRYQVDKCYLVMEYVEGRTLREILDEEGVLPINVAINYTIQIAQSLCEAHHKGVVHRDLKPDNIMVVELPGAGPFIKVVDFGIAKIINTDKRVTEVGKIVGTPNYMAPEQGNSVEIDHRADIYSLGCVLYEMLTGYAPFEEGTFLQIMMAHQFVDPPRRHDHLPPPLVDVIDRMLAKDPADRIQNASDLSLRLMECARVQDVCTISSDNIRVPLRPIVNTPTQPLQSVKRFVAQSKRQTTKNTMEFEKQQVSVPPNEISQLHQLEFPVVQYKPKIVHFMALFGMFAGLFFMLKDSPKNTLTILSEPSGATVYMNEKPIGFTPYEMKTDDKKTVNITLGMQGYEPEHLKMQNADSMKSGAVYVRLNPKKIDLNVKLDKPSSRISINEMSKGALAAHTQKAFQVPWPKKDLSVTIEYPDGSKSVKTWQQNQLTSTLDLDLTQAPLTTVKTAPVHD